MSRPKVIIHFSDYYDFQPSEKWKDRFMALSGTMSLGLIRYLRWPGDLPRFGGPAAKDLGEFGVYRYDEEATQALRAEMLAMNPKDRWDPAGKQNLLNPKVSKAFNTKLREAIVRLTGAD